MSTSKPGQPPGGQGGGGGGNPYSRFIPKEELGRVQAWNPETFVAPSNRAVPEGNGGVRKPTLAERAAAEVNPFGRPGAASPQPQSPTQASNSSPAQPQPAAASQRARPEPAAAQQAARPAPRRPVVGGVPGEEPEPAPQAEAAAPSGPSVDELVNEARQVGYQDGYRNGLAVVPIVRDSCGGCFNVIPPQRQSEIRQHKKIIVCEHCGRILVDSDMNDKTNVKL